MVQFEWFGHYSLISTIVNPWKKKKDLIANSLVNLLSESIKNLLVKKKLENETHANRVEA